MKTRLEKFDSDWIGISISFHKDELDLLMQRFAELRSGEVEHFHFRNLDFTTENGIADVEISILGEDESDNMEIE